MTTWGDRQPEDDFVSILNTNWILNIKCPDGTQQIILHQFLIRIEEQRPREERASPYFFGSRARINVDLLYKSDPSQPTQSQPASQPAQPGMQAGSPPASQPSPEPPNIGFIGFFIGFNWFWIGFWLVLLVFPKVLQAFWSKTLLNLMKTNTFCIKGCKTLGKNK